MILDVSRLMKQKEFKKLNDEESKIDHFMPELFEPSWP